MRKQLWSELRSLHSLLGFTSIAMTRVHVSGYIQRFPITMSFRKTKSNGHHTSEEVIMWLGECTQPAPLTPSSFTCICYCYMYVVPQATWISELWVTSCNLLEDDSEWDNCMPDVVGFQMPSELLSAVCPIYVFCQPKNPLQLWFDHKSAMI